MKKDLPKVEKELKGVLEQWEEDHERYFVVSDSRYLDTIARQWVEKDEQKEKEKIKRVSPYSLVLMIPILTLCHSNYIAQGKGGDHLNGDGVRQQTYYTKEDTQVSIYVP